MSKNSEGVGLPEVYNELQKIRKLLVLQMLAQGISDDTIDKAVEMGPGNIRGMFSKKEIKKSMQKWNKKGNDDGED